MTLRLEEGDEDPNEEEDNGDEPRCHTCKEVFNDPEEETDAGICTACAMEEMLGLPA
jgi:hypothetical protein